MTPLEQLSACRATLPAKFVALLNRLSPAACREIKARVLSIWPDRSQTVVVVARLRIITEFGLRDAKDLYDYLFGTLGLPGGLRRDGCQCRDAILLKIAVDDAYRAALIDYGTRRANCLKAPLEPRFAHFLSKLSARGCARVVGLFWGVKLSKEAFCAEISLIMPDWPAEACYVFFDLLHYVGWEKVEKEESGQTRQSALVAMACIWAIGGAGDDPHSRRTPRDAELETTVLRVAEDMDLVGPTEMGVSDRQAVPEITCPTRHWDGPSPPKAALTTAEHPVPGPFQAGLDLLSPDACARFARTAEPLLRSTLDKIKAIKELRAVSGFGLKDAKEFVDWLYDPEWGKTCLDALKAKAKKTLAIYDELPEDSDSTATSGEAALGEVWVLVRQGVGGDVDVHGQAYMTLSLAKKDAALFGPGWLVKSVLLSGAIRVKSGPGWLVASGGT